MTKELVLITGVSGHIGFRVLAEALAAGYRVRGVVRKDSQVDNIKSALSIKAYVSDVEFAVIPDFTAANAFEPHLNDVSAVLHVASPQVPNDGSAAKVIKIDGLVGPALKITQNVLDAASKFTSIKRVVITSSISVLLTGESIQADSDRVYTSESPIAEDLISPAPEQAPGILAYVISKIRAAKVVEEYVRINKPHFSIVSVLPATTVGRNELASGSQDLVVGGNMVALAPLLGFPFPNVHSVYSHIDDVAVAHVKSISVDVPSHTVRKILPVWNTANNGPDFSWNDSIDIVKSNYPATIENKLFNCNGNVPTLKTLVDSSKDEEDIGVKFRTYEAGVMDAVAQFILLAQAATS